MIIDHTYRLKVCIDCGRAKKRKTSFFHIFCDSVRELTRRFIVLYGFQFVIYNAASGK